MSVCARRFGIVQKFRAKNDPRYYLKGTYLEKLERGVAIVATNGVCMAVCIDERGSMDRKSVIVPPIPEAHLKHSNDVNVDGDVAVVTATGGFKLYVSPNDYVDGQYPNYRKVIPQSAEIGLNAPVDTSILKLVLGIAGGVQFFTSGPSVLATYDQLPELLVLIAGRCMKSDIAQAIQTATRF